MNEEKLEEMRVTKKQRQKKIVEAVEKNSIQTQGDLVTILDKHYGIKTNQSAVSRDIDELNIERDPDTNCYILGVKARRNKEANKLAKLMQQANVINIEEELSTMLLKGKVEYMPLIATQIEELLVTDDIHVSSFVGHNGSLLLYFPKDKKAAVERILQKIFSHISK